MKIHDAAQQHDRDALRRFGREDIAIYIYYSYRPYEKKRRRYEIKMPPAEKKRRPPPIFSATARFESEGQRLQALANFATPHIAASRVSLDAGVRHAGHRIFIKCRHKIKRAAGASSAEGDRAARRWRAIASHAHRDAMPPTPPADADLYFVTTP